MTRRAVLLGLLCAGILAAITHFNDQIIMNTQLIFHYLPISVFGTLVIALLLLNPFLFWMRKEEAFTGKELAVITGIVLLTCFIPGRGFAHHFTNFIMLPHKYEQSYPGWEDNKVLDRVPTNMLAVLTTTNDTQRSTELDGYTTGLDDGDKMVDFHRIPWKVWMPAFKFWLPLVATLAFATIGLSLVVHRQWSRHENLPYPVAIFANSLLPGKGESRGPIFRNKLFMLGCWAVFLIHMYNLAATWFKPEVKLPLYFKLGAFAKLLPVFEAQGYGLLEWYFGIIFAVVGFAYFLPTDVSFSIGIAPYVYATVLGGLAYYAVPYGMNALLAPTPEAFVYAGAYFGMFLVLLHTGRRHYANVCRGAIGLRTRDVVDRNAIWGARAFALCSALFIAQLCLIGLDWPLAILYTAGVFIIFTVIARLLAETGTVFIHPWHFPCAILLGLLGFRAIGPTQAVIMAAVTSIIIINPREALMPFAVHALKIGESAKARIGRMALAGAVAIPICLVIAAVFSLRTHYSYGAMTPNDYWPRYYVPTLAFNLNSAIYDQLEAQGTLEMSESVSGLERFAQMRPMPDCLIAFAIPFALVLLFTFARMRFPRWPIHPVLFLVLGNYGAQKLAAAFLIGCAVKAIVSKYGGASTYQKLKPLMIGLIAGELIAGMVCMLVGIIYYLASGDRPSTNYTVFPL